MDNPTTLLVAIMYVTIIATGLMTTLLALADIVGGRRRSASIHTAWILLLLVSYFNFFWETTAILGLEGWDFLSFLGFVFGPVFLLFATNLITAVPEGDASLDEFYFGLSGRFFALLVLVQAWIIGLDVFFEAVTRDTYLTAGIGILFVVLALSKSHRLHIIGASVVGLAFVSQMVLQAVAGS